MLRTVANETVLAFIWCISGVSKAVRDRIDVSSRSFVLVRYLGSLGGLYDVCIDMATVPAFVVSDADRGVVGLRLIANRAFEYMADMGLAIQHG